MWFVWSSRPQWFNVRRSLVQKEDPWCAPTLWAPPAISPPVCSPARRAMFSGVPRPTLCNVKHQERGIPLSRFVLVCLHLYFSTSQYFTVSIPLLWEKIYDSLKSLTLTSSVPLSVLQLSSVPLSRSQRMALPAVEKTQTWGSATETPAASAVCPAIACRDRAVWPARQRQSGVRPICLAVKVRARSENIPAVLCMIKMSFLDFCFCDKHF